MNFDEIKSDFPILKKTTYLDSAATSLTPLPVLNAMNEYYFEYRASPHRGSYANARKATEKYEESKEKVAKFVNCKAKNVVYTKNCSEAINLVALGSEFNEKSNIVTTVSEHHSNFLPWLALKNKKIIKELKIAKLTSSQEPDFKEVCELIDENTSIVAVSLASNVLGNVASAHEASKVVKKAHSYGAKVVIDAAQFIGHHALNCEKLGADFFAFSAHKMLGPTGIGVLVTNCELAPSLYGGGTVKNVSLDSFELLPGFEAFEAGTQNTAGAIGLAAAIDYLQKLNVEKIEKHNVSLAGEIYKRLVELECDVYGPKENRGSLVAFNVPGVKFSEVASYLDSFSNVAVRSGHHCAIPLTKTLGIQGSVRASVHIYNNKDDIEKFAESVQKIKQLG